jgi:metal-responsive CopG/Arc/MetJ family transcriptional regulator
MTGTVEMKRKGGRVKGSGKGREPMISARFSQALVDRIDVVAGRKKVSRSVLLREFIEAGLEAEEKQGEQG